MKTKLTQAIHIDFVDGSRLVASAFRYLTCFTVLHSATLHRSILSCLPTPIMANNPVKDKHTHENYSAAFYKHISNYISMVCV